MVVNVGQINMIKIIIMKHFNCIKYDFPNGLIML